MARDHCGANMTISVRTIGWRNFFTVLIISGALVSAAVAQEPPTYQSEYNAYNQAVENGDRDAAERHGRAAWQLAEETLGDHQVTGILAFNYGQLVIFSNAKDARTALRRANKLREAGLVDLPEMDLNLFLAYAEFVPNRQRPRQTRALREALLAVEQSGVITTDTATMWLHLAIREFQYKRYDEAVIAGEKAEAAFDQVAPDNFQQKANAIVIAGAAKLTPVPRKIETVESARRDFHRAIFLFPAQEDFESFDRVLAQAHGWSAAADAALGVLGKSQEEINKGSPGPWFKLRADRPDNCNVEWESRPKPRYPSVAAGRGYIGAVMVVYDLGDDLAVHNPRVLSEVPVKTFSRDVLKNMKTWKLKSPPVDHPACRQLRTTQFTFVIPAQ